MIKTLAQVIDFLDEEKALLNIGEHIKNLVNLCSLSEGEANMLQLYINEKINQGEVKKAI